MNQNLKHRLGSFRGGLGVTASVAVALALGLVVFTAAHSTPEADAVTARGPGGGGPDGSGVYRHDAILGSCGIVDEKDVDEVQFSGRVARLANSVSSGKAVIRCSLNLPFESSVNIPIDLFYFGVRCKDNGENARVQAKLKRVHTITGAPETIFSYDSNDRAASDSFVHEWTFEIGSARFWHAESVYYVEVILTKTAGSGRAEIETVSLWMAPD